MEKEILKINLLTIAASGFMMLLGGIILYCFKERVSPLLRYFLPLAPLGVASYVFVFNFFKHYNGELPDKWDLVIKEILYSTLISALLFGVFTASLIALIHFFKKIL